MQTERTSQTTPISHGKACVSITHPGTRALVWPAAEIASQGISRRRILIAANVTSQQLSHYAAGRFSQISRDARRRIASALIELGVDRRRQTLADRRIKRNVKTYRAFHAAALAVPEQLIDGRSVKEFRDMILYTEVMP